ncbi:MAG: hypothetical protein BWY99_01455 [Synergistetes bacterium ADurb.BinA166]|nr:MAG: hypothetical protein BWY99_01455 [Synergistetes bacterium ADurb.BinA166]
MKVLGKVKKCAFAVGHDVVIVDENSSLSEGA